jgi:hypothetical protein
MNFLKGKKVRNSLLIRLLIEYLLVNITLEIENTSN